MTITVSPISKYLHIEATNGQLYIYRSDRKFDSKLITVKEMDMECLMENTRVCLKLEDFLEVK